MLVYQFTRGYWNICYYTSVLSNMAGKWVWSHQWLKGKRHLTQERSKLVPMGRKDMCSLLEILFLGFHICSSGCVLLQFINVEPQTWEFSDEFLVDFRTYTVPISLIVQWFFMAFKHLSHKYPMKNTLRSDPWEHDLQMTGRWPWWLTDSGAFSTQPCHGFGMSWRWVNGSSAAGYAAGGDVIFLDLNGFYHILSISYGWIIRDIHGESWGCFHMEISWECRRISPTILVT